MKQSFIRQGTCVVCTNMTCSMPQKVGVTRAERYVMNTKANEPLLNVDDRKISASFCCRNPISFYSGLCALCVGVCIGIAITAAIVATGGAAAVAAAALLATKAALVFTGAVVVGSALAYTVDHDCDETLACEWSLPHNGVMIEGRPALLNQSYMNCTRGGRIEIVLNEKTAIKAAAYISSCNTNALWWQMGSQAVQGVFIGMATAATGSVGLIEMGISVATYCFSEYDNDMGKTATAAGIAYGASEDVSSSINASTSAKEAKASADAANKATSASKETMTAHQNMVKSVQKTAAKPGREQAAARQTQSKAQKAYNIEKSRYGNLKNKSTQATKNHQRAVWTRNAAYRALLNGLALNISTAILNYLIDDYSNVQEAKYILYADKNAVTANASDQDNGTINESFMGIVANAT